MIRYTIQDACRQRRNAFANELSLVNQTCTFSRVRAAVAYVTTRGLAVVCESLHLGQPRGLASQWLVSIDFGRTEPDALRQLANLGEVRVHDGLGIINRPLLRPNIVYHPKSFVFDCPPNDRPIGLVCGSANTTSSGVAFGIEHTVSRITQSPAEPADWLADFNAWWQESWDAATVPSQEFVSQYAIARARVVSHGRVPPDDDIEITVGNRSASDTRRSHELVIFQRWAASTYFFMDAGAAGANLPDGGNQLDAPRGTRVFFGFGAEDVPRDHPFGSVTIRYFGHQQSDRTVKYGNNAMDKINLPGPGDPFPANYVNTCLCFQRIQPGVFAMRVGSATDRDEWIERARAAGTLSQTQAKPPRQPRVYGFFD